LISILRFSPSTARASGGRGSALVARARFLLAILAGIVAAGLPVGASAEDARIVNGLTTHDFPSTGALLYHVGGNAGAASTLCSGTLIGCSTFLTAAHCVAGDPIPSHYFVYLQNAGVRAVTTVAPNPSYTPSNFPIADVAVLRLAAPVTGVRPIPVNQTNPTPFIPRAGIIAGFGQTLGGAGDYGIKRYGAVQTASCQPSTGGTNTELVCWNYQNPIGAPGTDSNTCNADSGGSLFMDFGSGSVIAGTTSGGTQTSCGAGDHSFDANVYNYRSFILGQLGSDSTIACGAIPAIGVSGTSVIEHDSNLSASSPSRTFVISLSSHVNVLRFAMNGKDDGTFNPNLYVRHGAPATSTQFDCKADGSSTYGGCDIELPATGDWHVLVQWAAGAGDFQLTTTAFGGPPPACGNNIAETGEDCDGADAAACPGLCIGLCACPPPVCGNGVVEQGEACDGTNDAACTAGCGIDCQCTPACGDGTCGSGESAVSCAADCGCLAVGACAFGQAPAGCFCDDLCSGFGDCCPDACVLCGVCEAGCGNGILESGEECDDGNTTDGDCCSSICETAPVGSTCDDATACTSDDSCSSGGECEGQAAIATGCFVSATADLQVLDKSGQNRDRLKWKWTNGEALVTGDLGDPSATTVYELCVFDQSGGTPSLALSSTISPSSAWLLKPGKGWKYADRNAASGGVRQALLRVGPDGKTRVQLKARGTALGLPGPAELLTYFSQDPSVLVQLINSSGRCWTNEFFDAAISTPEKFKSKVR
jgi:cysteine-rich repeat protein